MELTNYEDRSKLGSNFGAGFQFEFSCASCSHRWKSPFKPYRRGQFTGLLFKVGYLFAGTGRLLRMSSVLSDTGEKNARAAALQEALALAESRYSECRDCGKTVCEDCWDDGTGRCRKCRGEGQRQHARDGEEGGGRRPAGDRAVAAEAAAFAGPVCSNCQTALDGGRFCAECGFDMASTHKSCPDCGTMCARSTRFCAECGHGF